MIVKIIRIIENQSYYLNSRIQTGRKETKQGFIKS